MTNARKPHVEEVDKGTKRGGPMQRKEETLTGRATARRVFEILLIILGGLLCLSGLASMFAQLIWLKFPGYRAHSAPAFSDVSYFRLLLLASSLKSLYGAMLAVGSWAVHFKVRVAGLILRIATSGSATAILVSCAITAYVEWHTTPIQVVRTVFLIGVCAMGVVLAGLALLVHGWLRTSKNNQT
jgi:hypothetical protein